MTPNALVTMVKARLANSNDAGLDSLIIDVANVAQERLERSPEIPWFLFADTDVAGTNLVTVASTETVALPSNFLREPEDLEHYLWREDTDQSDPWIEMHKDDYSRIKKDLTGEGKPTGFDVLGNNLYLRQIPDAAYNLRLMYMKRDEAIVAGTTENLWLTWASDWIMAETGYIMASTYIILPIVAQAFQQERSEAAARIMGDTVARNEAGRIRKMGES